MTSAIDCRLGYRRNCSVYKRTRDVAWLVKREKCILMVLEMKPVLRHLLPKDLPKLLVLNASAPIVAKLGILRLTKSIYALFFDGSVQDGHLLPLFSGCTAWINANQGDQSQALPHAEWYDEARRRVQQFGIHHGLICHLIVVSMLLVPDEVWETAHGLTENST